MFVKYLKSRKFCEIDWVKTCFLLTTTTMLDILMQIPGDLGCEKVSVPICKMSNCAFPPPGYKAGGEVKWAGDTLARGGGGGILRENTTFN